jgi:hypothetical protein
LEEDKVLLLLLDEIKEINHLEKEKKVDTIQQMSKKVSEYQNFFNSFVENSENPNQNIVREIRSYLLRLSILSNPETRNLYRTKISHELV